MPMKVRLLAVLALAGAGTALAAQEAPAPTTAPEETAAAAPAETAAAPSTLEELDQNKNGLLNRHEASANPLLKRRFGALDKNVDHQLDQAEFAQFKARAAR
jgi:hypothetical protein